MRISFIRNSITRYYENYQERKVDTQIKKLSHDFFTNAKLIQHRNSIIKPNLRKGQVSLHRQKKGALETKNSAIARQIITLLQKKKTFLGKKHATAEIESQLQIIDRLSNTNTGVGFFKAVDKTARQFLRNPSPTAKRK